MIYSILLCISWTSDGKKVGRKEVASGCYRVRAVAVTGFDPKALRRGRH
jgi:hypothetical protein